MPALPAVEMLISEYRPLFTQPFNLRRYEADAARQAAAALQAEQQRAESTAATAAAAAAPLSSPLLTPIRCERLSVMAPEGASPFSDCCATPLPASPVSLFLAAAMDASSGMAGAASGATPPSSPMTDSAWAHPAGLGLGLGAFQQLPPSLYVEPAMHGEEDAHLEQAFSDLLESTVSGMLFDLPELLVNSAAGASLAACGGDMADEQPGSPVGVLREMVSDGGDSTDGSGVWEWVA